MSRSAPIKVGLHQSNALKELGRFIIQTCPTYDYEKCSRRILSEINIYCQYNIQTIRKTCHLLLDDDNFYRITLIKGDILCIIHCN